MEITWRVSSGERVINEGKDTGNKKHKWQVQNRQREVKNSIGNGEAKELTLTTQEHELKVERNVGGRLATGQRGIMRRKKWDNCNCIINKIYLKNTKRLTTIHNELSKLNKKMNNLI